MKCVLCGFEQGHETLCDRNPAKGQPIEYQLARVACAIAVPKGFGQCVDGTDGQRVGTNVATVEEWRQFFVTFLAQGVMPTIQSFDDPALEKPIENEEIQRQYEQRYSRTADPNANFVEGAQWMRLQLWPRIRYLLAERNKQAKGRVPQVYYIHEGTGQTECCSDEIGVCDYHYSHPNVIKPERSRTINALEIIRELSKPGTVFTGDLLAKIHEVAASEAFTAAAKEHNRRAEAYLKGQ